MEKKIGDCMKMHKKILLGSLLAVTSLSLTACGSNSSSSDKSTLNWMESTELTSLDPSKASDYTSIDQLNNTYVGLYRLGNHAKTYKAIAAKTTQSADGKTWTF
jgi:oligopeptide transport system substrate-binding protein